MQKHISLWRLFAGSAVLGGLFRSGPMLLALASNSGQPAAKAQQNQEQAKSETFIGKIAKNPEGDLVLKEGYTTQDPNTKVTYKLDDQEKAKQYVGKAV